MGVFKNDETVIPAKRIRTARSAMRIAEIIKVRSKETGGQWSTDVKQLTSNCAAESFWFPNNLSPLIPSMSALTLPVLLCLKVTTAVPSVRSPRSSRRFYQINSPFSTKRKKKPFSPRKKKKKKKKS